MKICRITYLDDSVEYLHLEDDFNAFHGNYTPNVMRIYKGRQLVEVKESVKKFRIDSIHVESTKTTKEECSTGETCALG